ncbi:MAG: DNA topoisomerase VI subunit B, partial [Candidatus Heimdallarchaeaceae archaeon]
MSENTVTKKMSAAAFFNENRAIAGFGNSMRAVFTSIRELVENGLDAAENRGINPNISIDLRKLSSREINELLDVKQYKKLEKHLDFLQLTCTDNGTGVPGHLIADLFGRVLTGTKYGVIQTRGRFGLGAKMCLLYSMSSVDLPAKIRSRYFMDDITHEMHLMINLEKNEPIIMEQREFLPGDEGYLEEAGTEISITFTGAWNLAKNSVREYFRQLAIITPYSSFQVKVPGDKEGEYDEFIFESVVDDMPPPPQVVKIHPYGCDITQFKAELSANNDKKLKDFLANQFMGVTKEIAEDFFQLLEIDPNKHPNELTSKEIRRIVHEGFVKAYQEAKEVKRKRDRVFQFDPPKGTALSPLGAGRLKRGLEKELDPKFAEAISRPPKAYSGHPFVVEAAIGYGGGVTEASQQRGANVQDNKIIYRYANRIPLIFGAGNDVISHVISSIKWNEYGLTRQSDPLAVTVSLVSTKIPFPETSKEYISIVPEIEEEIRLALQQLGRRLKTFLGRAKRRRREHARLSRFVKSAPIIVENLSQIIEDEGIGMADFRFEKNRIASSLAHGSPKKAKLFMPLGQRLFGLNIWCSTSTQNILKNKNILSVSDFLLTPTKVLMPILTLDEKSIYNIKLRTIYELDKEGLSPQFDSKIFVSRAVEGRFDKNSISLKDALNRRWIQNSYHYLATETAKLKTVSGLLEKLFESKKDELINQLLLQNRKNDGSKTSPKSKYGTDSLTAKGQLKIEHLFPPFKVFKKLSNEILAADLTVEEFIYQIQLPDGINYQQELTTIFIDYLKEVFIKMSNKFPTFKATSITKM